MSLSVEKRMTHSISRTSREHSCQNTIASPPIHLHQHTKCTHDPVGLIGSDSVMSINNVAVCCKAQSKHKNKNLLILYVIANMEETTWKQRWYVIRWINHELMELSTKVIIDNAYETKDESLNYLASDRYEIFVENKTKSSSVFDAILEIAVTKSKERGEHKNLSFKDNPFEDTTIFWRKCLRECATAGAVDALSDTKDCRDYEFGNFSLIVTYYDSQAEIPHIDVTSPSQQFKMYLVKEEGSTSLLIPRDKLESIQDIKTNILPSMPDTIVKACNADSNVGDLIARFGDLLHCSNYKYSPTEMYPAGGVEMIPGNMMHCSPATTGFHATMFFTGWPSETDESELYNCETRYNASTLLVEIALQIKDVLDRDSYSYLLLMIGEYTRSNEIFLKAKYSLAVHYSHIEDKDRDDLVKFLIDVEKSLRHDKPKFDHHVLHQLVAKYTDERYKRDD